MLSFLQFCSNLYLSLSVPLLIPSFPNIFPYISSMISTNLFFPIFVLSLICLFLLNNCQSSSKHRRELCIDDDISQQRTHEFITNASRCKFIKCSNRSKEKMNDLMQNYLRLFMIIQVHC